MILRVLSLGFIEVVILGKYNHIFLDLYHFPSEYKRFMMCHHYDLLVNKISDLKLLKCTFL